MAASVAVIGPGAIGGTVAAWLSHSPKVSQVAVCVRTPLDRLEVEMPDGRLIQARPRVITDPGQIAAPVDWVMIATKAYDVAATARWLGALIGPRTQVAVLQNGVEHVARFAPHVGADRIVPVVVEIPAERSAPGRIRQRRDGTLTVPDGPSGQAFVSLFSTGRITAATTPDFATVAWTKLTLNCVGAINALTGLPGGVVGAQGIPELMRAMVGECVAVGRAEGADLGDHLAEWVIERTRTSAPDSVNSLLADRLAGRPMEWDARNGVIVRRGEHHGIATPINRACATLLAAIETGQGVNWKA